MTVVKLLYQTVETRESNIRNRTRRSNIRSNGIIARKKLTNHGQLQVFARQKNHSDTAIFVIGCQSGSACP